MAFDPRTVQELQYIASEQFIWDDLIRYGEGAVQHVREHWRDEHKFPRTLISWPAEPVACTDDPDTKIERTVSFVVPEGMHTTDAAVKLAVATKAYALLLVERDKHMVRIILESKHGSRCWTIPIERHGDVEVLGKEKATKDSERIGVLWRPSMGAG